MPKEISFKTKPQIALEQLRWAYEAGLPRGVALLDAGYGANTDLRANITTLERHTESPRRWDGKSRVSRAWRR